LLPFLFFLSTRGSFCCRTQITMHCLATDVEFPRERGFLGPFRQFESHLLNLFWRKGPPPAFVDASQLGDGNAFSLLFPNKRSLEFGKRPHDV
jgi:hypothetical protein